MDDVCIYIYIYIYACACVGDRALCMMDFHGHVSDPSLAMSSLDLVA